MTKRKVHYRFFHDLLLKSLSPNLSLEGCAWKIYLDIPLCKCDRPLRRMEASRIFHCCSCTNNYAYLLKSIKKNKKKCLENLFFHMLKEIIRNLYILKLFNLGIEKLNKSNDFHVKYENNLLILNVFFIFL